MIFVSDIARCPGLTFAASRLRRGKVGRRSKVRDCVTDGDVSDYVGMEQERW